MAKELKENQALVLANTTLFLPARVLASSCCCPERRRTPGAVFKQKLPPSLPFTPISVPTAAAVCCCLCQPGHTPLQRISIIIEKCLSTAGREMKFPPISIIFLSQAKMKNNSGHKEFTKKKSRLYFFAFFFLHLILSQNLVEKLKVCV